MTRPTMYLLLVTTWAIGSTLAVTAAWAGDITLALTAVAVGVSVMVGLTLWWMHRSRTQ